MYVKERKSTRSRVVKALDAAFSAYIRARDGQCVTCGHLLSRNAYGTRWDETNAFCQCPGCNFLHEHEPHYLTGVYLLKYGSDEYRRLAFRHSQPTHYPTWQLELLLRDWKKRLKEVGVTGKRKGSAREERVVL